MGSLDIYAALKTQYTDADPPLTRISEPDDRVARKARQWAVKESDLRELVASATVLACNKINELTQVRYPTGSMNAVPAPFSPLAAQWRIKWLPVAEAEAEKFANVQPDFDELQAYANT